MDKQEKQAVIADFAITENDVGSPEVQVAVLTRRIAQLSEHMRQHRHDYGTRRGLIAMVNRRRKLLNYLQRKSVQRYKNVIERLKLRH
ncbi:MAG: 30S ribosomal protein S15 [Kiritimatiellaeota bacterium]|nr:30S ribosomal protein S15 [Kiritimatiellota bacterium]